MKYAYHALTMHPTRMHNEDCLGNSCLLLVLLGSANLRAEGHAHMPRPGLSNINTHPNLPREPGLASSALVIHPIIVTSTKNISLQTKREGRFD